MLYITMLRCRQKEKMACLTHYNDKFVLLKNEEKVIKKQIKNCGPNRELVQQLKEITIDILEVEKIIINLKINIKDNEYHIEKEEAKLANEAAKAKARVIELKKNKSSVEKLKRQMA